MNWKAAEPGPIADLGKLNEGGLPVQARAARGVGSSSKT